MKKTYSSKNSKAYSNYVVRLLKDFGVICSEEQKQTIRSFPTEEAVDRYKQQLMREVMDRA